jgi:hypothetical protein
MPTSPAGGGGSKASSPGRLSFHRYVRMGWLAEDWGGDVGDLGFGEPV